MKVLVAGIGHSLRGDDAAGLEAVRAWQRAYPGTASDPRVIVELLESPGLDLARVLEEAQAAVLVDAVISGGVPGQIHRITESEVGMQSPAGGSAHGWGIPEAVRMARALGWSAGADGLRVLGIEASQVESGAPLSPGVSEAIPAAAAAIETELRSLLAL